MTSAKRYRVAAGVMTLCATVFYFAGLVLPMATLTKKFPPFVNTTDSYNLVQTIRNLFRDHENLLGIILVLFTFVFPLTKMFSLFMGVLAGWDEHNSPLYRSMKATGRLSMLDVFVVALLVVMLRVKTMQGGMTMKAELGIYCFGASVLLAIWAGNWIGKGKTAAASALGEPEAAERAQSNANESVANPS